MPDISDLSLVPSISICFYNFELLSLVLCTQEEIYVCDVALIVSMPDKLKSLLAKGLAPIKVYFECHVFSNLTNICFSVD